MDKLIINIGKVCILFTWASLFPYINDDFVIIKNLQDKRFLRLIGGNISVLFFIVSVILMPSEFSSINGPLAGIIVAILICFPPWIQGLQFCLSGKFLYLTKDNRQRSITKVLMGLLVYFIIVIVKMRNH